MVFQNYLLFPYMSVADNIGFGLKMRKVDKPEIQKRVQDMLDGTWKSEATWGGIGSGMVEIGEISDAVPAPVKAEALKLKDDIASGAVHPFTGPINKQDGSVFLADGETATDDQLHSMTFYVEGIKAEAPK